MSINRGIIELYSKPLMSGGALPYFVGKQYDVQQGGNWLQRLGRFALPILQKFGIPLAKSAGRAIVNTARDAIVNKKSLRESMKNNLKDALPDIKENALGAVKEGITKVEQGGFGLRKRKRRSINKRRKPVTTIFDK